jgi:hypothetical protein
VPQSLPKRHTKSTAVYDFKPAAASELELQEDGNVKACKQERAEGKRKSDLYDGDLGGRQRASQITG